MPPYGLYSLANTPEELLSRGYGYAADIPMMDLSEAERNIIFTQNDPAFGNLNTDIGYFGAPFTGERSFQNALFLRGDRGGLGFDADIENPSFGGVSGYRDTGGIMNIEPAVKSVDKIQRFQAVEDDDLEASAIPEFGEGQLKQRGGIADLLRAALGFVVPGANFFLNKGRDAMSGIRSLNQRLRNTDFGQSKTLQEYFQKREARKEAERLAPIEKQLREASERGGGYQPTTRSQNVARTASRVSGGKTRAYGL